MFIQNQFHRAQMYIQPQWVCTYVVCVILLVHMYVMRTDQQTFNSSWLIH